MLDLSRQVQSYLSVELLEATVYRLEQICHYVLVLAGANSYLNDLFVSLQYCLALQPAKIFFIHLVIMHQYT